MVSVCLPSDALLQHLPSYLGFSYLGRGVSLHGCSSKVQPLLLTLDEGYLLTTTPPDLEHGVAPLGPPASLQPLLLGRGVPRLGLAGGISDKQTPTNAGDVRDEGSIPGSGRSPGVGNGDPLQHSFAWEIPWAEEPGELQSVASQRVRHI